MTFGIQKHWKTLCDGDDTSKLQPILQSFINVIGSVAHSAVRQWLFSR